MSHEHCQFMSLWIWAAPMCHPQWISTTSSPRRRSPVLHSLQLISGKSMEIWHESRVLPRFVPSKQWVSCNGSRIKSVQHDHILQAFASAQTNKLPTDIQIECRLKLAAACHRSPCISQGPHARFSPQANSPQHVVIPVRIQCHDWLVGSTHSKNVQKEESVWNNLVHYPKYGWTPRCSFSILVCLGGKSSGESHHRPRCLVQSGQCCRQFPENGWSFVLRPAPLASATDTWDQDGTKVKMWCWPSMIFHDLPWISSTSQMVHGASFSANTLSPDFPWMKSSSMALLDKSSSVARYESHDLYGAINWQRAHQPFAWILHNLFCWVKSLERWPVFSTMSSSNCSFHSVPPPESQKTKGAGSS